MSETQPARKSRRLPLWLIALALLAVVGLCNKAFSPSDEERARQSAQLRDSPRHNACYGFAASSIDTRLQMMLGNISRLDASRVNVPCLNRRVDELVHWMARRCSGGYFPKDVYAMAFVDKTREMCP